MTESKWLASDDPAAMLRHLFESRIGMDAGGAVVARRRSQPLVGDRKLRLFACACARAAGPFDDGGSHRGVEAAERFADGGRTKTLMARHCGRAHSSTSLFHFALLASHCCEPDATRSAVLMSRCKDGPTPEMKASILREIVGNPFRPITLSAYDGCSLCLGAGVTLDLDMCPRCFGFGREVPWLTPDVLALTAAAYEERGKECPGTAAGPCCQTTLCPICPGTGRLADGTLDPVPLAILADALEEAGCRELALLSHLRSPGPHVRGCFAVDFILGKDTVNA